MIRVVTLAAAAIAVAALGGPAAEARKSSPGRDCRVIDGERVCFVVRRQQDRSAGHDRVRAESVDPAGNYRAYPDWARWALSPKGGDCVAC